MPGKNAYFTTLFDFYSLPIDFPGRALHVRNPADPTAYVLALEEALFQDIGYHRFIPYLQLHEFETMLFADPAAFRISFENCDEAINKLAAIANSVPSVEHIDDGMTTAPSKRIIGAIPEYDGRKSTAGPDIAAFIGISAIRTKCPHFDNWLRKLEGLVWED